MNLILDRLMKRKLDLFQTTPAFSGTDPNVTLA